MSRQIEDSEVISARREDVLQSYKSAIATNYRLFKEGDDTATSEYIYPNQMEDAYNIVNMFYSKNCRVISIQKKTKVGADGLMIEIAKLLTTHNDDEFVVNPKNVRILTGMSNAGWEKDMICKAPGCFKDKIKHHGQLKNAGLHSNIRDSLIIIDEIDTGDGEKQVLHTILKDAGILDAKHMKENNNRFVFISATMIKELYDLYRWGDLHELYKMTIPSSYIGHKDFLDMGIVKEYYDLSKKEGADKWVSEDIIENYGEDYRVHIVRVKGNKGKGNADMVQDACIRKGVLFKNHTSKDRLSPEEISSFFKEPLKQHIVIGIKGLFRRANLIPNRWKLRIGATHELFTKTIDNNVQIQGLTGRMSGYWRDVIEDGHKTGPHRTSIKAIEEYEKTYNDPYGVNDYQSAGFTKKKGKINAKTTMLTAKNIPNLEPVDLPVVEDKTDEKLYRIYKSEETMRCVLLELYKHPYNHTFSKNKEGFIIATITTNQNVLKLCDAIKAVDTTAGLKHVDAHKKPAPRRVWPCYKDTKDKSTLYFLVLVDPQTISQEELKNVDAKYPEFIII
jgi:hypothetical protein|uniref:Helicase ATP-binding domain-containing protein n=1 Tax=viral metagenome TaxID=1070528 RepID=A0A6C0I8S6_9ZZZZ